MVCLAADLYLLVGMGWIGAGLIIFALRSTDRRAILISVLLMMVGPGFGGLPYDLALARPEWMFIQRTYIYLASVGFLGLALLFPTAGWRRAGRCGRLCTY
jgi:hypothetical protein